MKSFQQFILEAYDKDVIGRSQIRRSGEGGRIYPDRKSGAQTKRTKAVGGGKTAPAKHIKPGKMLELLILSDLLLEDNNNQLRKEAVPHYQQKRHKRRHI